MMRKRLSSLSRLSILILLATLLFI